MKNFNELYFPDNKVKYVFFGGKGGVGKTTVSTATALWFADHGYKTTIISTDPTVSLSAVFNQELNGRSATPIRHVPNLCGLNVNPNDAKGVYQQRLNGVMGQLTGTFGNDIISTPCMEEMAAFDQFVSLLEKPESEIMVFDTAPTGKTLRELAMPFDWARFLQNQIVENKELASMMNMDESSSEGLERDKKRYDDALGVLRDKSSTAFTMVLLPERLPVEETASAIKGLGKLDIPVQSLVVNQCILQEVIQGNSFLDARAKLQKKYINEIETRFAGLEKAFIPLLDHDVSEVDSLRNIGRILFGE